MTARYYTAIVERNAADGFSAFFPDVPGCTTGGATMEEVASSAEEALALHFDSMLKDGDDIPDPTPMEQIPTEPDVPEAGRLLVRADLPGRAVRVQLSVDEGLLARTDATARQIGMSRSAYVAAALRNQLRADSMQG